MFLLDFLRIERASVGISTTAPGIINLISNFNSSWSIELLLAHYNKINLVPLYFLLDWDITRDPNWKFILISKGGLLASY